MIVWKVWKASTLCVCMSALVFCVMVTAFLLEGIGSAPDGGREEEAVAVMAAVDMQRLADAQERITPSTENLFYLPAPEATPCAEAGNTILLDVIRQPTQEIPCGRVLIYHTHTWEAYEQDAQERYVQTEKWRTKDTRYNVVRVGAALSQELTALGFDVTHVTQAFEPPVLSTAYARSLEMLEAYEARGETFDYYIDLHRDAYSEGAYPSNTVTGRDGEMLARLMMLIGKGTGEAGGEAFDEKPQWEENLALAQQLTDCLNAMADGLCGNVKIKTGRFNQHISTSAVLVEVGNNKNTLAQALASMPYLAQAIKQTHDARCGL